MRLKKGFVLTEAAGECLAVPTGEAAEALHGVIRLNETGKVIWEALAEGLDERAIAVRLKDVYDVDDSTAVRDVHSMLAKLREAGIIKDCRV